MGNEDLILKLKDLAVFLNEEASGSSRRLSKTYSEFDALIALGSMKAYDRALTELYRLFPEAEGKLDNVVYVSGV